jgi:hypothetical protein
MGAMFIAIFSAMQNHDAIPMVPYPTMFYKGVKFKIILD